MIEGLTTEQTATLTAINVGCSALSFAGSLFIVLCYLSFRNLRKFSFRLIFFLSLSDMLCSFFNLLGNPGEGWLCYVQGYATQFFWVASFLWTTTIAYTLHSTVVRHKADVVALGPLFHIYVWGTALVMTVLPSLGNDYGPAGAWCWVQNETTAGKVLRFLTFYVPLWAAIVFNAAVYVQVIRMIANASRMAMATSMSEERQRQQQQQQQQLQSPSDQLPVPQPAAPAAAAAATAGQQAEALGSAKLYSAMGRWGYYPVILIGSWAFGTVNKIHNLVDPDRPIFWLYCLHIGTAALMGLFNSIAYGLNTTVRRTLAEMMMKQDWPLWLQQASAAPAFMLLRQQEDGMGAAGDDLDDEEEEDETLGGKSELACLGDSDYAS